MADAGFIAPEGALPPSGFWQRRNIGGRMFVLASQASTGMMAAL